MSALVRLKLAKCTDPKAAQRALELLNKDCAAHMHSDSTMEGYGYGGTKADVLVRKMFFSGLCDLGFAKQNAAEMQCLYDSDDTRKINKAFGTQNFEQEFMQYYSAAVAETTLQSQGYGCSVERDVQGVVHVNATAYA